MHKGHETMKTILLRKYSIIITLILILTNMFSLGISPENVELTIVNK
jgi:hypothetical protein